MWIGAAWAGTGGGAGGTGVGVVLDGAIEGALF